MVYTAFNNVQMCTFLSLTGVINIIYQKIIYITSVVLFTFSYKGIQFKLRVASLCKEVVKYLIEKTTTTTNTCTC